MTRNAFNPNSRELHQRGAEITSVNAVDRTIELSFSSEAEVVRWFGIEILSHGGEACDLSRLNDGGAVLDSHDRSKQIGVIEKAWIGSDYVGRARVRFSTSAAGREIFQDVKDGIRRNVSVGYTIVETERAGARDGLDVILVKRWVPHEISIVSVPADATVGVGRSADMAAQVRGLPDSRNPAPCALTMKLRNLVLDAENARTTVDHTPAGFHEPTRSYKVSGVRSMFVSLKTESLPALINADGKIQRAPNATIAASTLTLSASLVNASRVAQAGTHVIVMPEKASPVTGVGALGLLATQSVPEYFKTIEGAKFSVIDIENEGEVQAVPQPLHQSLIDWRAATSLSVRFEIPYSQRKRMNRDDMYAEIMSSLALGLPRAADECLLQALNAATLAPFELAAAATRGLKFNELRAIVGTDAAGAVIGQDGSLRAAGIGAELTGDMAGTIIGAWDRAAIVVRDDVEIFVERLDKSGELAVTAWVAMLPLVPDPTMFWSVA